MDTEIKNTLFRFVNMKAPELCSEIESKPNFITQNPEEGYFFEAINSIPLGNTKRDALLAAAEGFSDEAISVNNIKDQNEELYYFSIWLAKNKRQATNSEIETQVNLVTNATITLSTIWENLVYQVITQKDFYVKESLMQTLIAHHVCTSNLGTYKERALAKVVLPKILFTENGKNYSTELGGELYKTVELTPQVTFANPIFTKLEKQAIAKENIKLLTKLKSELVLAEKKYRKEYQSQYKKDYADYQVEIKPLLDTYNADVKTSLSEWCAVRPTSTTLPYDPTDPCQKAPVVAEPEIPEFNFTFMEELDATFISEQISPESYMVFENLNKYQDSSNIVDFNSTGKLAYVSPISFDSYESIYNGINQLIDAENQNIIENNIDNGNTAVIIGGTTVTIPNTTIPLEPFQYEIKTRIRNFFDDSSTRTLQLMVGIPDTLSRITAIQYDMTKLDNSIVHSSSTVVNHYTGYDAMVNLSMNGITANLKELLITIQLANGTIATIQIPNFALDSTYKNFLLFPNEISDVDILEGDNDPGTNSTVAPSTPFIPSGFGVKQIGIADYNKVEQSIHGYVEGEVAHIENVMAREFKEKSTRRLRRSEITETTSSETEREQLTDTTSVDRFEMQNEVAKVIANSKDFAAGVGFSASWGGGVKYGINSNANFATHNSNEQSTRQAVTSAKEITERALDRIVSKIKEERIEKILEEFEENNSHGFDNRKGDKHVVGVYRWVDKVMKNQIINYGKRLMFEFMIPEPAQLHKMGMQSLIDSQKAKALTKPEDPRTALVNKLENYSELDETKLKYWTGKFNVEFENSKRSIEKISKAFKIDFMDNGQEGNAINETIEIPEGYVVNKAFIAGSFYHHGTDNNKKFSICVGNNATTLINSTQTNFTQTIPDVSGITQNLAISASTFDTLTASFNVVAECFLTDEGIAKWKQETFNTIINAYEEALNKYNEALATEQANGVQILGSNPGFYREIENTILRKNCISYLISNNPNAKRTFGKNFYKKINPSQSLNFDNTMIDQNADLDDYAGFVKFMEQAFEWDIMSYYFYPFYWGNRNNWVEMYQFDQTHDQIFKAFMQSGMAKAIVTVRPGFEEAVKYYMQTGQIWNGGEVPVIGDELFLSIVDELQKPEGEKVGKAWPTRIPTSMTILQAQSIGLNVTKALPFNEDLSDFENPDEVPQSSQIIFNNAQIGGGNSKTARIVGKISCDTIIMSKIQLNRLDGAIQDRTFNDMNGDWEINNLPAGTYELIIDKDDEYLSNGYSVSVGSKQQTIELEDDQTLEVEITFLLNGSF